MLNNLPLVKKFCFLSLMLLASSAHCTTPDFKPYFGIEFQYDPVKFDKTELGMAKFQKWTPQERLFVGFQVNEYFASEFGFEFSDRTIEHVTLSNGSVFLGRTANALDDNDTHQLEFKSRACNVNFIGIYPHLQHNLSLLASIGFSWLNATAYDTKITESGVPDTWQRAALYDKARVIPTLGAGIQWLPNQRFGFRLMGVWQNKSRLDSLRGRLAGNNISATLKNSTKVNAAILIYI